MVIVASTSGSSPAQNSYSGPNDFKKFLLNNNIVITAAAITIGIASAAFIKSFVGSILMPSVYLLIGRILLQNVNNKLYKSVTDIFGDKVSFDVDLFLKDLITWVLIVIAAYFIMDILVRRWLLGNRTQHTQEATLQKVQSASAPAPVAPPQYYTTTLYEDSILI